MPGKMSIEKMLTNREPMQQYWQIRLERVKNSLEKNNFEVFVVDSGQEAKRLVIEDILPGSGAKSIAWGGTMTMEDIGLGDMLRRKSDVTKIDPMDKQGAPQSVEHLRKSLSVDLFIAGTNAVTETGHLVNLDMLGNRVGAITFGPTHVVLLVGRNKIVPDLESAMARIRNYVAPAHVRRLSALFGYEMELPCMKTGFCQDCKSPMRICNAWGIIEKSYPKGRIKVILINEELGL